MAYSITIDEIVTGPDFVDGNAHARAGSNDPQISYLNRVELINSSGVTIAYDETTGNIGAGDLIDNNSFRFSGINQGNYTLKAFLLDMSTGIPNPVANATKNITVGSSSSGVGSVTLAADDPRITSATDPVLFTVTVKNTSGQLMSGVTATYSIDGATVDGQFQPTNALGQAQVTLTFSDTQSHQIFATAGGKNSNLVTITPNTPGGGGGTIGNLSPWLIGGGIILAALALRRR